MVCGRRLPTIFVGAWPSKPVFRTGDGGSRLVASITNLSRLRREVPLSKEHETTPHTVDRTSYRGMSHDTELLGIITPRDIARWVRRSEELDLDQSGS